MLDWFRQRELPFPVVICDNNKEKQGTKIEGIPVVSFETALLHHGDLKVLITSNKYGNEMEQQVLEKLSEDMVLNIQWYFEPENNRTSLFAQSPPELQARVKRYTGMLRGEKVSVNSTHGLSAPPNHDTISN